MLLIVTPNYKGEVPLLAKTASSLGWDVYSGGWRIPKHLLHQPGAVYGEQFFCEVVAEQMKWKLLSNSFDWLAKVPEEYLNRKVSFMTLAEARKITERKFIKPADDKCFVAKIYESGAELPKHDFLDNTPTLVSDVVTITSEYRCFVKKRRVTAVCCYYYKPFGKEEAINDPANYNNNNEPVIERCNKLLENKDIECVDGTVIDWMRFAKDQYSVLECNPVYASGAYGCEMVAVLDAIAAACVFEG